MIQTVFKRQEIKFLLDRDQRARLERAMCGHVVPDAYGPSTVCNVYYDTPTLLLARRSADHPAYKEKLRTRSYGVSDGTEPVFAELKKKYDGVVYKRRATLPPADADALLSGRREGATQIERELAFAAGRYEGLAPRAFVAYDREAFFAPDDHEFRMTFDRRVRARWERLSLCDGDDGDALLDEASRSSRSSASRGCPCGSCGTSRPRASARRAGRSTCPPAGRASRRGRARCRAPRSGSRRPSRRRGRSPGRT